MWGCVSKGGDPKTIGINGFDPPADGWVYDEDKIQVQGRGGPSEGTGTVGGP